MVNHIIKELQFYQVFVTASVEWMELVDICQRVCLIFRIQLQNIMMHLRVQANPVSGFKSKGYGTKPQTICTLKMSFIPICYSSLQVVSQYRYFLGTSRPNIKMSPSRR